MKREDRYDSLITYYAQRYGRDPRQVKRQIRAESNFNPYAVSRCGARGLAQFMEPTWGDWGTKNFGDAFNAELSIGACCRYMNWLEKRAGPLDSALAAYNFGLGNILHRKPWPKETQKYVKKCLEYEREKMIC